MRPQWVKVDTPEGLLVLTWPRGQVVYDELEAVAELAPQDAEWSATLDGRAVPLDRARAILTAMRDAR